MRNPSDTVAPRLSASRAHAARRASVAAAGLMSAMVAHVVAFGEIDLLPIAPALWAMLIGIAAVLGARSPSFVTRAWPVTLGLVVASQMVMHIGMVEAPWAFGLRIHHEESLVTPAMLVTHLLAAVVLVAAVCWFDRLLGVLSRVVSAVLGTAAARPRTSRLVVRIAVPPAPRMRVVGLRRAFPSRGPPLPV